MSITAPGCSATISADDSISPYENDNALHDAQGHTAPCAGSHRFCGVQRNVSVSIVLQALALGKGDYRRVLPSTVSCMGVSANGWDTDWQGPEPLLAESPVCAALLMSSCRLDAIFTTPTNQRGTASWPQGYLTLLQHNRTGDIWGTVLGSLGRTCPPSASVRESAMVKPRADLVSYHPQMSALLSRH